MHKLTPAHAHMSIFTVQIFIYIQLKQTTNRDGKIEAQTGKHGRSIIVEEQMSGGLSWIHTFSTFSATLCLCLVSPLMHTALKQCSGSDKLL